MSRRRLAASLIAVVAAVSSLAGPTHAMSDLVVRESKLGVKEALDAAAKAVEAKGMKVIARIDHAAGARAAGLEMRPTEVLVFGNPKAGTPLMAANPEIGIDLPLKMLAWQAADGKVYVGYTAPEKLKDRHGIKGHDEVFKAMSAALLDLAAAASGAAN